MAKRNGKIVIEMSRENAGKLGILVCFCGCKPEAHYVNGVFVGLDGCGEYREVVRYGKLVEKSKHKKVRPQLKSSGRIKSDAWGDIGPE